MRHSQAECFDRPLRNDFEFLISKESSILKSYVKEDLYFKLQVDMERSKSCFAHISGLGTIHSITLAKSSSSDKKNDSKSKEIIENVRKIGNNTKNQPESIPSSPGTTRHVKTFLLQ